MIRVYFLPLLVIVALLVGSCHTNPVDPTPVTSWRTLTALPASSKPLFLVSANGSLYAGTGTSYGPAPIFLRELWQYDATDNTWIQKKDFQGKLVGRNISYFVVNNKLYVGFGLSATAEMFSEGDTDLYSYYVYEYDPATDNWQTINSPVTGSVPPMIRYATGTTFFTYQNKGVALWGTYRPITSQATLGYSDGVTYTSAAGWDKVNLTLVGTPVFPETPTSALQYQLINYRIQRRNGFGFTIGDRVYTGGGDTFRSSTFDPFQSNETLRKDVESRDLYVFDVTPTGNALNLVLSSIVQTPATGYDLTAAHLAFPLSDTGYIIANNGKLISYTPSSNQWHTFAELTRPVVVGTSLNDKAYFINETNQLLEYTPN
ncbi:Kelch repeat-containing protein [Spirosoma pomorum]